MDTLPKIKLLYKETFSKQISLSDRFFSPIRDWNSLRIVFFVLILISIIFDLYMYKKIVSGDMYISVQKSEVTVENLKSAALDNILNTFEIKQTKMLNLKLENLVDPSI